MSSITLGLDGGGTGTEAVLLDEGLQEIGRGQGGACNIAHLDLVDLKRAVFEARRTALVNGGLALDTRIDAVCAAVAGYSVEEKREPFATMLAELFPHATLLLIADYEAALYGATEGKPGIVMIAGTGATAYGRNEAGETQRVDGLGYLLGDRGSGFNLGLYGLRHALERLEVGAVDLLSERILFHLGAKIPAEAVRWLYTDFTPARVASLAPLIGELAEAGDNPSRNLVAEMARRLRHSVRQIRYGLQLPADCPVYPVGGLWNIGPFFRNEFASPEWRGTAESPFELESLHGGKFVIAPPKHDPATGAALLALASRG